VDAATAGGGLTAGVCAAPGTDTPLVRGLLNVVDCNTQALVHSGYSTLFEPSSAFATVLTTLLTLYVGIVGYRLLLGQSQLRVSDFALSAVKIGAVLALATQWDTYQTVVYRFLFEGPQQLASLLLSSVQPSDSAFRGNVFDGLQRAFDDLSGFANLYAAHSTPQASPLMGGTGFGALVLTSSASILLLSSLGVLLAAKIVLSLLLAIGPLFFALFLFDSTRGLFEGWVRAAIAFAFAPFASILLLGVALTMLEPSLLQMEDLRRHGVFVLGPVFSVATLILVFSGVSLGAVIAGGMIARGFKLPEPLRLAARAPAPSEAVPVIVPAATRSRVERVAAAATAMGRREMSTLTSAAWSSSATDRRTDVVGAARSRAGAASIEQPRLGQSVRRAVRPRTPRPTARSA
jgi:type IV secretion system protein VirB6